MEGTCYFQVEKGDKEKEGHENKEVVEEKRFDPSGYDHDLVEMLGKQQSSLRMFFLNYPMC